MNKPPPPDIPPKIADRPRYTELPPDEERAFIQKLAEFEAAFRQTGDPLPLWEALYHVERSGQTVPHWLTNAFFRVVMLAMTDDEIRRARERWWHAKRYTCVRDLRQKGYTRDHALDQAVIDLRAEGDKGVKRRGKLDEGVSRDAVEDSYDKVRKDLERRGCESQYYLLVNKTDEGGPVSYPSR
jgi:hypothetical protein